MNRSHPPPLTILLVALTVMLPAAVASDAAPLGHVETRTYASMLFVPGCYGYPVYFLACLTPYVGETQVTLTMQDASGLRMGGNYRYLDASGQELARGWWCSGDTVPVPASAATLQVVLITSTCTTLAGLPILSTATAGQLTATFQ